MIEGLSFSAYKCYIGLMVVKSLSQLEDFVWSLKCLNILEVL